MLLTIGIGITSFALGWYLRRVHAMYRIRKFEDAMQSAYDRYIEERRSRADIS